MLKTLNTILISVTCTTLCIYVYHHSQVKERVQLENDYARLVAYSDQNVADYPLHKGVPLANESFVEPASRAKDAVVAIEAISVKKAQFGSDKYSKSNGSGVIISSNGYIVTNYHVIKDAKEINLILEDRREFKASLEGFDVSTDLALLRIESSNLPFLKFGDSDELQIGEWVMAIGNPFKLSSSVTAGIVSAKARNIDIFKKQGIESLIQTDAAINPGNSGGALINTRGELVGINTAILTYSGKYEGFSFAMPSTLVEKITEDLMEHGAVQRAWLGVSILSINEERAKALQLDKINGVYIDLVEKDGSAKEAGLMYEDVIVSIDGKPTLSKPQFMEVLGQYRPGDKIKVEYIRKAQLNTATAILHNQLNTTDYVAVRKDKIFTELGFELRNLDGDEKDRNEKNGVMVVSILKDSKIESVNMDPGYIITSINGKQITNVNELKVELEKTENRVYLNGFYENYPMEWPYKFSK